VDLMVPSSHGRWLSSPLPTASAHHHPEDGHFSIYRNHFDELTAALRAMTTP